jgi:lantibiotic modifying enzyme
VLGWAGGGSPLDPLRVRPRLLLRNTAAYQQILEAASGPKYLASPEARRTALRTITKFPVIGGAGPEGLADAELSYLDVQTYPRFVISEDGTRVVSDDGKSTLLECDPEAPRELLRQRWHDLSGERIRWNSEIVSAACRQAAETRPAFPPGGNRCLLAALEIGNALERQAIRVPEGASWLGLTADGSGNAATEMPGGDFFSGSAGVAVFLARLGEATGERRFTDLAVEAMRFSDHYWTHAAKLGGPMPWSAYHGAGSLLFAAGLAGSPSDSVREMLLRWLETANRDRSWLEMNGDHLAGLPGWTLALASLSGMPLARNLLRLSLTRLLDPSLPGSLTTPGLAHGTAGWVMAVTAAARELDDVRATRAAREVIATFSEKWAEFETRQSVRNDPPGGWCNGAIGLMAAAAEHPETADCARQFLEKARLHFAGGHGGHHLCCGEAGRILLLSRAAKLLPGENLAADARRCADALLGHVETNGFLIFQGIPERLTLPGWMTGISGVGAALLAVNSLGEDFTI